MPLSSFPTSLDNYTTGVLGTEVLGTAGGGLGIAALHNNGNDAINKIEIKLGADSSAVTTTIDYLLKNTASVDPGHKHTSASASGVTGSGNFVLATSPTLVTPTLGVATATTINKVTLTAPASAATITIANNKTLTVNNTLTLAGTDSTTMTFPVSSDTVAGIAATQTFTNKRNTKRTVTVTQSATPTINTDNTDVAYITGLAQAITSMTTNLSGTPNANDALIISITDNGTARAITWGASFESSGNIVLPTTTVISTRLDVGFLWNTATSKWRCVGVA